MRIVTTTCSNTEIVCSLGCSDMLVGVDDHSDFPPEVVADLPRVGPDLSVSPEKIKALNPDLVLASLSVPGHEHVISALQAADLPEHHSEPFTLADVYDDILSIAGKIGRTEQGQAIVNEMMTAMPQRSTPHTRKPRILIQWWPKPIIAPGKRSWVNDLIDLAGGCNPLAHEEVTSRPLAFEEIETIDPDAIIIAWCGVKPENYRPEKVLNNPALQNVRAIQNGDVYCIAEAHLGRPSPRLIDGYRDLCHIIDKLSC